MMKYLLLLLLLFTHYSFAVVDTIHDNIPESIETPEVNNQGVALISPTVVNEPEIIDIFNDLNEFSVEGINAQGNIVIPDINAQSSIADIIYSTNRALFLEETIQFKVSNTVTSAIVTEKVQQLPGQLNTFITTSVDQLLKGSNKAAVISQSTMTIRITNADNNINMQISKNNRQVKRIVLTGDQNNITKAAIVATALTLAQASYDTIIIGSAIALHSGANTQDVFDLMYNLEAIMLKNSYGYSKKDVITIGKNVLHITKLNNAIYAYNRLIQDSSDKVFVYLADNPHFQTIGGILKRLRAALT